MAEEKLSEQIQDWINQRKQQMSDYYNIYDHQQMIGMIKDCIEDTTQLLWYCKKLAEKLEEKSNDN